MDGMGVTFLETFVRENAHVATRRICLRREPLLSSCGRAPYSCREIRVEIEQIPGLARGIARQPGRLVSRTLNGENVWCKSSQLACPRCQNPQPFCEPHYWDL